MCRVRRPPPPLRNVFRARSTRTAHLRGLRRHRKRPRVDVSGIEEVAEQAAHVVALLVDDAEDRGELPAVHVGQGVQRRRGRALDGRQRHAQLVAHHAQEPRRAGSTPR